MLKIHFLLRQPKRKGRKAIYATVRYQCQTAILYPNLCVHSNDWVSKPGISKPKDMPENSDLKDNIYDYEKLIRDTHIELQKLTPGVKVPAELLKKAVYAKKLTAEVSVAVKVVKDKPVLITDFFQTMIDETRKGKRVGKDGKAITEGSIKVYETTKKHFEDFQQKRKYYLTGINQKLIDDFSDYLNLELKMSLNGSGKNMKAFKTMMNYARQKKMISADLLQDSKVTVTKESVDNIYLTEQEIDEMMLLNDFESPLYEVVRDLFVIGCKTGLRFGNYSQLEKAFIDNDFIQTNQVKVYDRVIIPIHPIVQSIFEKYRDGLPKCPPNQVFNRYIKEIAKKIPSLNKDFEKIVTRSRKPVTFKCKKFLMVQSHSARRSFCTNEYLNGTPTITIRAISGHKTEAAFMEYIKADSLQHALLMKDLWAKRISKGKDEKAA